MAKIIQIQGKNVFIRTDNGIFLTANFDELNFVPSVGDEVDVFLNGGSRIISKKENLSAQTSSPIEVSIPETKKTNSSKRQKVSYVLGGVLGCAWIIRMCVKLFDIL